MTSTNDTTDLPNLVEILGAVLQRVPREHQPLLIALAERLAADRYRGWAKEPSLAAYEAELLACAAREERIAGLVESLYPDAARIQADIAAANPDLEEINRSLFASGSVPRQLAIQAQGERLGAATWRSLAREADEARKQLLLTCAELEEESALLLEQMLSARR
jgi:hypothetical protein